MVGIALLKETVSPENVENLRLEKNAMLKNYQSKSPLTNITVGDGEATLEYYPAEGEVLQTN